MRKRKRIAFAAFTAVVISLYVVIFVVPDVADAFKKTTVLEYGRLTVSDAVTGYMVRNETVYLADRGGEIRYYVGDGVKIRKGARLLDIVPASQFYDSGEDGGGQEDETVFKVITDRVGGDGVTLDINSAETGGVVSYYADGYEKLFSPENLDGLTREKADGASEAVLNLTRHKGVIAKKGEAIYKIMEDALWYMVFWLEKDSKSIGSYVAGGTVTALMENGEVRGRVQDVLDQGDYWRITTAFDRYYEGLARIRKAKAEVIAADYSGLVVGNGSIASEDGQAGLYVKRRSGDFEFVPVNVLKSDGEHSIISASSFVKNGVEVKTVNIYEEVLTKPRQTASR